jgi:hypothetical protein
MWKSLIDILPRGNTLSEADWQRRHRLLQWVLLVHVPVLAVVGFARGNPPLPLAIALTIATWMEQRIAIVGDESYIDAPLGSGEGLIEAFMGTRYEADAVRDHGEQETPRRRHRSLHDAEVGGTRGAGR